jgi:hypothetical protein
MSVELAKRWTRIHRSTRGVLTTTLTADSRRYPNRAFIQALDEGEFGLFVWNDEDGNWCKIGEFPTLRAAKAVGRILAAKTLENI